MHWVLVFLFNLAICVHAGDVPEYSEALDNGTYGYYPIRTYATSVATSPQTNFLQHSEECDDGLYYFITPRGWSLTNPGPMILDYDGELIWSADYGGQAYDFMVQKYLGEEYLTFWLGDDRVRGHGSGFYYMLNSSYDIVHTVGAANGLSADLHEFLITPEGTALMTMYEVRQHDVSEFREFDPEEEDPNYIWDCLFQEVDIATGNLIFEWRASEHIPLSETYHDIGPGGTKEDPFDWYHINSIEKDELGNYLISARYTHSVTYIDGRTKETIWVLGGKVNDFKDLSGGNATNFAWQHDARFLPLSAYPRLYASETSGGRDNGDGTTTKLLTLFDNAAEDLHYDYGLEISRGLLLEITYPTPGAATTADLNKREAVPGTKEAYAARVVQSYENPKGIRSSSQGSMQILPQGEHEDPKVLVGYGLNAVWTEFDSDGTVLCDVHFGADTSWERGDIQSYRAYKFAWKGNPSTSPAIDISDDGEEIYVSWNGATDVVDWVLQCSDRKSEKSWNDLLRMRKTGFETVIALPEEEDARYLRVQALGKNGKVLGKTEVINRGWSYLSTIDDLPLPSTGSSTLVKLVMLLVCNISVLFLVYELYRRYLSWRLGRPYSGRFRLRKGARLLGEA